MTKINLYDLILKNDKESFKESEFIYKSLEAPNKGFIIYSNNKIDETLPNFDEYKKCKDFSKIKNAGEDYVHRYYYHQEILENKGTNKHATVIMMNPAFAYSKDTDSTIENVYNYLANNNEKFSSFDIINLYTIRMPNSNCLNKFINDMNLENDKVNNELLKNILNSKNQNTLIAAWGSKYHYRAKKFFSNMNEIKFKCYAINKSSQSPKHFGSMAFNSFKNHKKDLEDYNL